ncbi:MAG: hypothetical protein AAF501_12610, partial [Pseudomonadota bacterium]
MTGPVGLPLFIGSGILYLHTEMIAYYVGALLLGLLLGYLIWGWGRSTAEARARTAGRRDAERRADAEGRAGEIGQLKSELDIATKARAALETRLEKLKADAGLRPAAAVRLGADPPAPDPGVPDPSVRDSGVPDSGARETPPPAAAPAQLDAPRGNADNLRKIKGIGPKLEKSLNSLGIYHFDQIAGWGEA